MSKERSYTRISLAAAQALAGAETADPALYLPRPKGADPLLYCEAGGWCI